MYLPVSQLVESNRSLRAHQFVYTGTIVAPLAIEEKRDAPRSPSAKLLAVRVEPHFFPTSCTFVQVIVVGENFYRCMQNVCKKGVPR